MLALSALAAALAWLAFVSHGFVSQGILDGVYEIQAHSLARGSLAVQPGLEGLFYHDMMIHHGMSYFYQGVVPSVFFIAAKSVIGRVAAHYVVVFAFLLTLVYFLQRLILDLMETARGGAPRSQWETYTSAILLTWLVLFVVAYPVERRWFFGQFLIYEQQIVFGLACAVPGVYFAIYGLREESPLSIAAAALCFGLAAATRPSWLVLGVAATPAATAWIYRGRASRRAPLVAWVVLGAALVIAVSPLILNHMRYGSAFDNGTSYQNPADYLYLRIIKDFYSPETRAWNVLFNALSFYFPLPVVQYPLLVTNSLSLWEQFPPGLFYFNPQFVPMLILVPLALVRTWKEKSLSCFGLCVLAVVAAYMNAVLLVYSKVVSIRFFYEFYSIVMLVFIGALAVFVRPAYVAVIVALCLAPYVPETMRSFAMTWPVTMTVNADSGFACPSQRDAPPHLTKDPVWPAGSFSATSASRMRRYNAIGVEPAADGSFLAKDLFAVYLVPCAEGSDNASATLAVRGLQSLNHSGTMRFFVDDRLAGQCPVTPSQPVDCHFPVPQGWLGRGPCQVLGVFFVEGTTFLPGREPKHPLVSFREVRLE